MFRSEDHHQGATLSPLAIASIMRQSTERTPVVRHSQQHNLTQ